MIAGALVPPSSILRLSNNLQIGVIGGDQWFRMYYNSSSVSELGSASIPYLLAILTRTTANLL